VNICVHLSVLDPEGGHRKVLYILSRDSATQVTVQTPATYDYSDVPYTIRRAYRSIQAWENARQGNLVADNRLEVGMLYNDGPFRCQPVEQAGCSFHERKPYALATIDGSRTDAQHFMWLTVAEGQRHQGIAGSGVVLDGEGTTKLGVRVRDHYTRVEWLELTRFRGADGAAAIEVEHAKHVLLAQLLIHDFDDRRASTVGIKGREQSHFTVRNCLIYDGDAAGIRTTERHGTATIENCTIVGMAQRGVYEDEGRYTVRNTIAMGNRRADFAVPWRRQAHNLSSDGTAQGPGSLPHKDPLAQFVALTPHFVDLHLRAGADAIGTGESLVASFNEDVDGDTRFGAWDIGADGFNTLPVAHAGQDVHAALGSSIQLDGSASYDRAGNLLTFQWFLVEAPAGSQVVLADPFRPNPQFEPDLPGPYVFELVVHNGKVESVPDRMTLLAFSDNAPPNARAGRDQYALVGAVVPLDGTGSDDPEQASLDVHWSFDAVPVGSALTDADIVGSDSATPEFVPDVEGLYVINLHVSDGTLTDDDTVQVIARHPNVAPNAHAGPDVTVQRDRQVTLDGSLSFDPDGGPAPLHYTWSLVARPADSILTTADIRDATTATPSFLPDADGAYILRLTVSDGEKRDADNVLIEVGANRPPEAVDDSASTTKDTPASIAVLTNDTDPDHDPLTVTGITQGSNGTVTFTAQTVTYTPSAGFLGTDTFTYTISDGKGENATATVSIEVLCPPPTITAIDHIDGPVGTEVTITGTHLDCGATPSLALNGTPAVITSVSPTTMTTFIPLGAQDGRFIFTTTGGTVTFPTDFDVVPSRDFAVTVAPADGQILQGAATTYTVELQSLSTAPFTGLATLEVTGLPSGITATFAPPTLTGGQRATLTLAAAATTPPGSSTLTVRATASIDAEQVTRTALFTLVVQAGGRTALVGQFTLLDGTPLEGIQLTLAGQNIQTDGGGNFQFLDVPAGTQMLGVNATPVNPIFPMYGMDVTLIAGQTTQLPPFRIAPPPPPERFVPIQNPAQDQVVTDSRFPGASFTVPAGVTIIGWNGEPKTQMAIERLSPDQLPVPPPPGPTRSVYQPSFGTPMGGLPSAPIPVTLPNDLDLAPGEKAELWYYDAAPFPNVPGAWRLAGLGTVSQDGMTIVSDPGVGIQRFCGVCGLACFIPRQEKQPSRNPEGPSGGDPVDLALGQMIVEKTDLVLPGRLPAVVHRTYNPFDPFGAVAGFELGLGPGWALSVEVALQEETATLRRIILPGNARFAFIQQPDGTFVNTTHSHFAGAVLTQSGPNHTLRFKDGTLWRFASGWLPPGRGIPIAGFGLLVEQADRNGNHLTIERDGAGKVTRLVEPGSRELLFTYTSGRITDVRDPLERTVHYGYNSAGRLATVTDPAGGTTHYTYDPTGRILTITDARGITYLTNEYDANGRVARQTPADGGVWTFQYLGPAGAPTGVTVTDPRGNATTQRFSPTGFTSETVDALGQVTQTERDARGQVVAITDPLGRVTSFTYDDVGNVLSITDPVGNVRRFEYEPVFNRLTKLISPAPDGPPGAPGPVTTFEYDTQGNLIAITDPEQHLKPEEEWLKTRIAYNEFGQPISTTDPLEHVTTFTYDAHGNLMTIKDPLGNTTRRTYDLVSRLIAQTDPRGRTTRFGYDALNRMQHIVDALNGVTAFTYDENGNLLTVTDALHHTTTHTYDNMDRLFTRTDPVGATEFFEYDKAGNLIVHTDRKQQVHTFHYDALNRRLGANYADSSTTSFEYDAVGRLVQADDSLGGTIVNKYDDLDRLKTQITGLGIISYDYDALGRRKQMNVSGQEPVSYDYDANSRLTQIVQGSQVVDFIYDAIGRRTLLTLPNGVSTEYTYDVASRHTELIYRNATGLLGNLTYQYDPTGNRIGVGGSFARTLLPAPLASASYNNANRQLTFGDKTMILPDGKPAYDANGNLISITDPTGTTTFTWDARNRLTALTGPGTNASFTYDPFGRRVAKQINGQLTQYLYDRVDIVQEFVTGTLVTYLRSLNIDESLVRNSIEYYLADALGSVPALTDPSGIIQTEYVYEPFGRTIITSASDVNPFQYTGRENDRTRLYYYRARFYDAVFGRFISEDPLGINGVVNNLYLYGSNNPINYVDPFGLEKQKRQLDDPFSSSGKTDKTLIERYEEAKRRYQENPHDAFALAELLYWQKQLEVPLAEAYARTGELINQGFEAVQGVRGAVRAAQRARSLPEFIANRVAESILGKAVKQGFSLVVSGYTAGAVQQE
jgi:RHS repeat-associated protein